MYFFLSNLPVTDLCFSSAIALKILMDLLAEQRIISMSGCATQFFIYALYGTVECYLLAMMAYDRYVAICNLLIYKAIMSPIFCFLLAVSHMVDTLNSSILTASTFTQSFCGSHIIDQFFCDASPLLALF